MSSLHCRAIFVRMTFGTVASTCGSMASPFAYLPHRAVLSLAGPDTITLLERLVTNSTEEWAPGETRYGALLTPQGKVIADYLAIRTSEGVLLDVAEAYVEELAKRQAADGSWVNSGSDRWMEGDPNLVTGYALLALSYCKEKKDEK